METILMSIHPKWCEKIFNGEKTIEVRKTAPKPPFKVVVYCTKAQTGSYKGNLYINPPENRKEIGVADWWLERKDELSINGGYLQFNAFLAHGKVIGEFEVTDAIKHGSVDEIPEAVIAAGCVSREFLKAYSKGKPLYANYIENVRLYDEPKELEEFVSRRILPKCGQCEEYECKLCHAEGGKPLTRAPQSWMHIETPKWAKE